ncbi:WYL domain-containing protein (plasmid) [Deinococcus psychrotolerans]|uniref:WYL domain-containing protein n=1 Tax=Deinococcus psychrotolerans TaxID=2489213 RepID=A0A3G8YIR4_9DEIO|nr:WYL domain-containing protein [Deinococcus psychrotolerans]AZI45168.1 WYL domain-containing protein [Deinococcus psychrotolerans]
MSAPTTKAHRIRAVLDHLGRAEYSARDLTRRLDLPDAKLRSVQRDLEELQQSGEIERTSDGKYRRPVRATPLNPVEALAVYSAARMLYHHAAEYNEHYLTALEKLTAQLPAPARRVALLANEAYRQRPNKGTSRTFELAAQAWLDGRVIKCDYHSPQKVSPMELIIYFIEVNARNREAYAIGVNRLKEGGQPYVYRLSRMRNMTLLSDECQIPEDFHPLEYLSNAWGIMTGETVKVELFFSPAVKERVLETHLGEGAEVVTLASGHTRVVLNVGGVKELVPWLLGWGGQVEVIGPPELRLAVADGHQLGAELYSEGQAVIPAS